ncbi:MAG: HNH endonuclease [Rivularia sp. (in: cyanobacteria)]
MEVEHIIPLSRGGRDKYNNLQLFITRSKSLRRQMRWESHVPVRC